LKGLKKYRLLCIPDHEINMVPIPVIAVGRGSLQNASPMDIHVYVDFRLSKNNYELNVHK
jgi:hypothetical protein